MADATRSCSISRPLRIAEALRRRAPLATKGLTAYRLFHGDVEGAPGLAVDRYGDIAVMHADSHELLSEWLPTLRSELRADFRTGYTKVHSRSAGRLSAAEVEALPPYSPAWGSSVESVTVVESDVSYLVRPSGLSVGLFLDMRDVRVWLCQSSQEKTTLNLFAYTCSLGVCAALGGARRVLNLDVSRHYLDWGRENYAVNGLATDEHDFVYGDAFDWLRRFARRGERFDVVIVDPPSFSSTPFSVTRDYVRLVAAAARVVSSGGTLLAATNHAATSQVRFDAWLREGLRRAGRDGTELSRWHEPEPDFPAPKGGEPYLKVRALRLD